MRHKLVSPKDTLLGHVDVPDHWFGENYDSSVSVPMAFWYHKGDMFDPDLVGHIEIKTITLSRAGWSRYRDSVILIQGTLEEFEGLPGCSFSPSAAYLRSLTLAAPIV
jgi:hypothetical protein